MLSRLLLILPFILCLKCFKFKITSEEELYTRQSLSECVIEAGKKFFTSNFETLTVSLPISDTQEGLVSSVVLSQLLLSILERQHRWSVLVRNLANVSEYSTDPYFRKSESYIIQIRKEGEISYNIKRLKRFLSWNPYGKFIVISSTLFDDPHRVAVEVIKTLWESNVVNVVVLLPDEENATHYKAYSWQPYTSRSCGNNFSTVSVIDGCGFGVFNIGKPWFEEKIPKVLFNCSVKVNYVVWPPYVIEEDDTEALRGIDINLLNTVADILKLKIIYNRTAYGTWGHFNQDGSSTNDFKHLMDNEMDVLIGSYVKTPSLNIYLDSSKSYSQDSLEWCVPNEPIMVGIEGMSDVYSLGEWVLLWVGLFAISLFCWVISNLSKNEPSSYKSLVNSLQNNYAIQFGISVKVLPRAFKVRIVMFLYIIFSFILNLEYTTYVTSSLSSQSFTQRYDSMETIYKNNLETYFISNNIFFFKSFTEKSINKVPIEVVLKNWKNCTNVTICFNQLASKKNYATCFPKHYGRYLVNNVKELKKMKKRMHCLKESVMSVTINLVMRRGFPLYQAFDQIVGRIITSGFIIKWHRDLGKDSVFDVDVEKEQKIKYKNLKFVFCVFLAGLGVSFVSFLGENIIYRVF